jgi:hypothetical protein
MGKDAMKRTNSSLAVLGLLLASLSGCKSFAPPEWSKGWLAEEPKVAESKYTHPARLAVVWSPAVLNSPGKKPTRGFGGRVYFYDGQNRAVPVEGQLVVYGYNDSRPEGSGKSPDRTYAFTPEQFAEHFSPTDLGASYSVWVPWDEVGSEQVEVSLVPIFTAASGQIVVGQSSKSLLPGPATVNTPTRFEQFMLPPPQITYEQAPGAFDVQRASYQEGGVAAHGVSGPRGGLRETSIRVPSTLAERMAQAGPQEYLAERSPAATIAPRDPGTATPMERPAPGALPSSANLSSLNLSSPTNQPLARFVRSAHPAPSGPGLLPAPGPPPRPPFHAGRPFAPPSSPPANQQTGYPAAWAGAARMP